jgi:surface polysaccharide O-acyltransferase-like enzyme
VNTARPVRDLAVDYYRTSGVVLIVLGHWLAAGVTYHEGSFGRQNPLVDIPWTRWLTWPLQAVPVFFLVAGYASAVSWTHWRDGEGMSPQTWLRQRLARVLGPTAVYVACVSAVVVVLGVVGVDGSLLEYAGWAVAMHLWFLAVYVIVVTLTPITVAAHRRWGLAVPAALGIAVVLVDVASLGHGVPYLGWLNYLLCWGTFYQLGIAWHSGSLSRRRAAALAVVSAVALGLLIRFGHYPVSMIGVPGQSVDNTTPPSAALLAFGCTQAGLAVALAPALNRVLHGNRLRRVLGVANENVMALYLWHMVPVVIVATVGYPAGLLPQPEMGTAAWWLARLWWLAVLCLVTAVEMAMLWWLRVIFAAPLPGLRVPVSQAWTGPALLTGVLMTSYGLGYLAAWGFAPDGQFPWLTGLIFAVGAVLAAVTPRLASRHIPPTPVTKR